MLPRHQSTSPAHIKENFAIRGWELGAQQIARLSQLRHTVDAGYWRYINVHEDQFETAAEFAKFWD